MSSVVLDTNVVFAAFATRGLCESTFELCLERHELITSDFLLGEIQEKLIEKLQLPIGTVEEILALYKASSRLVIPLELEKDVCRDAEDIPVLGTCLSAKVNFLVTGDKDLLELGSFRNTRILSPREFYQSQSR